MLNKNSSKAGFTLLEILIAVMIIGVLTTVALPLYRGAIDKSRWSKMIAPARAVATAQEAAYMNQGGYTANIEDLDISLPEGGDMSYTLYTTTNGDDANFVRIASTHLDNVRLARYYKNNEGFEDQLYCEAASADERANKLCGKLLKGEFLTNTDDGYKMYLLRDEITKPLCDKVELWWSNNFTKCYHTEEERCTANNMQYDTFCGWENTNGKTINEGGTCEGTEILGCKSSTINDGGVCAGTGDYGCHGSTINGGGECLADGGLMVCKDAKVYAGGICTTSAGSNQGCRDSAIYEGGVCEGNGGNNACMNVKVYDGGKCVGNVLRACNGGQFYEGSVCEGNVAYSCPANFRTGSVCNGYVANSCSNHGNEHAVFEAGSRCVAHVAGACNGDYSQGGCCEGGDNCPANAPRC